MGRAVTSNAQLKAQRKKITQIQSSLFLVFINMKGRASKKFQSFHPDSHKLFKSLVQNAKVSVDQPEDLENVDEEVANMIKNKLLTQVRQEDFVWEYNRKCKKLLNSNKSITWSCDLKEEFNFEKFDEEEEVFHREE